MGIKQRFIYDQDVFSKDGNAVPQGTPDEILNKGREMYEDMSEETSALIKAMLDFGSFDVLSREGKWGGGYCTSLPEYKMPFILANFNGTSSDIDVLTHEFGHALHFAQASKNVDISALRHSGSDTAEIASMSMEFLTHKYMDKFFGENSKKYRFEHYAQSLTFIPYGINIDAFQHAVFLNPEMTPDQRNKEWLRLEKKFRPHMGLEGVPFFEDGRGWQIKQHVYERPFYYIDYCLAQTIAIQFALLSLKDFKDAFARYNELLKKGGTLTFVEQVESVGLSSPFKKGALKSIAKDIDKVIKKLM
jgi:M3 family oligoendopeptidase